MLSNDFFVKFDTICDYLPIVSTFTNCYDIWLKATFVPKDESTIPLGDHFFTHLSAKSYKKCILFAIPFAAPILYFTNKFIKNNSTQKQIPTPIPTSVTSILTSSVSLPTEPVLLRSTPKTDSAEDLPIVDRRQQALNNIKKYAWRFDRLDKSLKNDEDFIVDAYKVNKDIWVYAGEKISGNPELFYKLYNARDDKDNILSAMNSIWTPKQKDNPEFMTPFIKKCPELFKYCSDNLKNDLEFVRYLIVEEGVDGEVLRYVPPATKRLDDDFVKEHEK